MIAGRARAQAPRERAGQLHHDVSLTGTGADGDQVTAGHCWAPENPPSQARAPVLSMEPPARLNSTDTQHAGCCLSCPHGKLCYNAAIPSELPALGPMPRRPPKQAPVGGGGSACPLVRIPRRKALTLPHVPASATPPRRPPGTRSLWCVFDNVDRSIQVWPTRIHPILKLKPPRRHEARSRAHTGHGRSATAAQQWQSVSFDDDTTNPTALRWCATAA